MISKAHKGLIQAVKHGRTSEDENVAPTFRISKGRSMEKQYSTESSQPNPFKVIENINADFNPSIIKMGEKDKIMAYELQKRIEDQRRELEQRDITIAALQRNFESLSALCKAEKTEKNAIRAQCEVLKKESTAYLSDLKSAQARIAAFEHEVASFEKEKARIKKLVEENTYLKMQFDQLQKQMDRKLKENGELDMQNTALKSEVEKVKKDLFPLHEKIKLLEKDSKEHKATIQHLQQENAKLAELNNDNEMAVQSFERQIARLKEELDFTKERLREKSTEINDILDLVNKQKQEKAKMQEEIDRMKNADMSSRVLAQSHMIDNEEIKERMDKLRQSFEGRESIYKKNADTFETQLSELKLFYRKELEEAKHQYDKLLSEHESLKNQNKEFLRSNSSSSEMFRQEIDKFMKIIADKDQEISALKDEIITINENMHSQFGTEKEQYQKSIHDLEESVRNKLFDIENLNITIQILKAEITKGSEQNEKDYIEIQALNTKIDNLRLQLELEVAKGERARTLQKESDDLKKANVTLNEKIGDMQKKIDDLQKKIDDLNNNLSGKSSAEEDLRRQLSDADNYKSKFNNDIMGLKKRLDGEISAANAANQRKRDLEMKVEKLQKENDILKEEVDEKNAEIMKFIDETNDLHKEIEKMSAQCEALQAVINKRDSENKEYMRKIEQMKQELGSRINEEELEMKLKVAKLKEEKINGLLSKLDHVNSSLETDLSCYSCLNLFDNATVCVPCGHHFCKNCIESNKKQCTECGPASKVKYVMENKVIDTLVAKFIYNQKLLADFKNEDIWRNAVIA